MVIIGYCCRHRGIVCEYATQHGYCQLTTCINGYSTTATCTWSEKVSKQKEENK